MVMTWASLIQSHLYRMSEGLETPGDTVLSHNRQRVILDVDTGVDDAEAIMLAVAQPHLEVVAITCVSGNIDVQQVCSNTLRVLHVCNKLQIPIYKGATRPLVKPYVPATYFHGDDGLGDVPDVTAPDVTLIQKEHAVDALARLAEKYAGEITLIALAPLTNLALAERMHPGYTRNFNEIVVMGGNIEGHGNIAPCVEFNFFTDPEAASIVLENCQCPLRMLPWETSFREAPMPWDWYVTWTATDTVKGRFHKRFSEHTTRCKREVLKLPHWYSCDAVCMALVADPRVVLSSLKRYCTVELHGSLTCGQLVVDYNGSWNKSPNVELITHIDTEPVKKLLEEMFL